MFVDRQKELKILNEILHRRGAQFVGVFGRRRIGKTALLNHWLETSIKTDGIYWVAHRTSPKILLDSFSQSLAGRMGVEKADFSFSSWEAALRQVATLAEKKRLVVIFDEFPYLIEAVPSITSMLQALWDQSLSKGRIMLVVCGSHFHMMRKELLSAGGPLYGRTTASLFVDEIVPSEIGKFLDRYSTEQIVETYSVIGGVPKYLEMWNANRPVLRNIEEVILSPATIFRQEPVFLIQDELPESRTYVAILEAIGCGSRSPKSISQKCGIALPHAGKYLNTLVMLGFVRRIVSIDAADPNQSRLSGYEISDAFLSFYFSLIRPYLSLIEQQRLEKVMEEIKRRFPAYVAKNGFERLCRNLIIAQGDSHELPFNPVYVGRLWNRTVEIDVAAIDRKSKSVLLGECKWTDRPVSEEVLNELKRKADLITSLYGFKRHFALFSKFGYTQPLSNLARKQGVFLFSVKDISV